MNAADDRRAWLWTLAALIGLAGARFAIVALTDLNLGPDEAQYWTWSKDLDFGYYSKPPLIAWIIAGTTAICGDGEACVRAGSPFLYLFAGLFVFEAGRALYGARTGLWAAIAFSTLPGITLSSLLITTDVPLLTLWAGAVFVLALMLRRSPAESRGLAALLGLAIGLAFLAKYAGAYFLLGLAIAAIFDRRVRAHALSLNAPIVLSVFLLCAAPNIWWNAAHGFATVSHTAYNAGVQDAEHFTLARLGDFLGAQFGVFGPILMTAIVAGLALGLRRSRWPRAESNDLVLLCISLPVLVAGLAIAFYSKANANWAAAAYVGLSLVSVAWLLRAGFRWLQVSTALAILIAVVFSAGALSPRIVDLLGLSNAAKLLRGWNTQGPAIARAAHEGGFTAVLAEDREDMASMLYYTRGSGLAVWMWTPDPAHPMDHFQMTRAYAGSPDRVLFISHRDDSSDVTRHFAHAQQIEVASLVIGKKKGAEVRRTFHLIDASGYREE